jgi:hypothetical protein
MCASENALKAKVQSLRSRTDLGPVLGGHCLFWPLDLSMHHKAKVREYLEEMDNRTRKPYRDFLQIFPVNTTNDSKRWVNIR